MKTQNKKECKHEHFSPLCNTCGVDMVAKVKREAEAKVKEYYENCPQCTGLRDKAVEKREKEIGNAIRKIIYGNGRDVEIAMNDLLGFAEHLNPSKDS